jgi:cation diffusion facilitator CzcD-associated flavoprotein CzcO
MIHIGGLSSRELLDVLGRMLGWIVEPIASAAPHQRAGAFPDRDTIVACLEDYARGLGAPIEYGVEAERLDPANGGWQLAASAGPRAAAHVVVATGRDRVPWMPDWPGVGSFSGELLHSAQLGDVARFSGKSVLVVGAGNSGADVMNHLARIKTGPVWVSVRRGPTVFPTRLLGARRCSGLRLL